MLDKRVVDDVQLAHILKHFTNKQIYKIKLNQHSSVACNWPIREFITRQKGPFWSLFLYNKNVINKNIFVLFIIIQFFKNV